MPPVEQGGRLLRPEPAPALKHAAPGMLFVVATPIGNREDITLRALRTLKDADLIACEDTRRTQSLLQYHQISTRVISYHEHNEMTRAPELVVLMEEGSKIALVSDAGVPMISDPGYRLVRLAIRHNIRVIPVPGPSAFVASLAVAGLPLDRFRFVGFLPPKRTARRRSLRAFAGVAETIVFYEAPHRVIEMLEDLAAELGDRPVVVAREVTKLHEEFLRGPASEVLAKLKKRLSIKGEITVIAGPFEAPVVKAAVPPSFIKKEMDRLMSVERLSERDALKALARKTGTSKSAVYRQWQAEKSMG
ncbi:MAG: 16S rRNA (cytidine(1402)-2'-O)-methyltransferase [Terriglobia bacterium]